MNIAHSKTRVTKILGGTNPDKAKRIAEIAREHSEYAGELIAEKRFASADPHTEYANQLFEQANRMSGYAS